MKNMNQKGIKKYLYQKAWSKYGTRGILEKLVEELGELVQRTMKLVFSGKFLSMNFYDEEPKNFVEEFADVEILMENIEESLGKNFRRHVDLVKSKKLERLGKRLKNDQVQNTDPESG